MGKNPTLRELGRGIVAASPYGLAGPCGLSPEVVHRLHDGFHAAMRDPAHVAEIAQYAQEPARPGPEDYGRAMRDACAAQRRTVERLGWTRRGR